DRPDALQRFRRAEGDLRRDAGRVRAERRRLDDLVRGMSGGPLSGLRVLDAGVLFAAPLAGTLLGDFGADVVKVEHPSGDPLRSHGHAKDGHGLWWKMLSRNKWTVTI